VRERRDAALTIGCFDCRAAPQSTEWPENVPTYWDLSSARRGEHAGKDLETVSGRPMMALASGAQRGCAKGRERPVMPRVRPEEDAIECRRRKCSMGTVETVAPV